LLLRQVLVELAELAGQPGIAARQRESVGKLLSNGHWLGEMPEVGRILSLPSPLWHGPLVSSLLAGMPPANPGDLQLSQALAQTQVGLLSVSGQASLLQSQWPAIESSQASLPNAAQRLKALEDLRDGLLSDFYHGQQQFIQRDKYLGQWQKRLVS
jgi:hypothetical protein